MSYFGNCMSIRGLTHVKFNMPCQDTSAVKIGSDYAIAIVADGHGSSKHPHSDIGSYYATKISLEVISEILESTKKKNELVNNPEKAIKKISEKIVTQWKKELSKKYKRNIIEFGTTLSVGVISDEVSFAYWVGDSPIAAIPYDSEPYFLPLNELCSGGKTTSLSDENIIFDFRVWTKEELPAAIIPISDGLICTYTMPQVLSNICVFLTSTHKQEYWYEGVSKQVYDCSRAGKQDDSSVAIIYDKKLDLDELYFKLFQIKPEDDPSLKDSVEPPLKIRTNGSFKNDNFVESGFWNTASGHYYYSDKIVNGEIRRIQDTTEEPSWVYTGEVKDFDKNGIGEQKYSNGVTEKGNFVNGLLNGDGEQKILSTTYRGSFVNGLKDGYCVEYSGSTKIFSGMYLKNMRHGTGMLYIPNPVGESVEFFHNARVLPEYKPILEHIQNSPPDKFVPCSQDGSSKPYSDCYNQMIQVLSKDTLKNLNQKTITGLLDTLKAYANGLPNSIQFTFVVVVALSKNMGNEVLFDLLKC